MSEKIIFILHIHETRIVTVRFKHVRRSKAADGYFRSAEMRLYDKLLKTIEGIESATLGFRKPTAKEAIQPDGRINYGEMLRLIYRRLRSVFSEEFVNLLKLLAQADRLISRDWSMPLCELADGPFC